MNIGLLTSKTLSDFNLKALQPILEDVSFNIKVALIDNRPEKSLKQKLKKNIKRGRGGYIIIMAFKRFLSKKNYTIPTKEYCITNQIDVIEAKEPYSESAIENIKKYSLDILLLLGGYGIIKKPLLNVTPKGVLSYHHGNMRKYRGMPFGFWELYYNETEMGITVQILSEGLDCGLAIEEKTIEIKENDTVKKLQCKAFEESEDMLYKALKKLSDKKFDPEKISIYGEVYTLPNLRQWVILKARLLRRRLKIKK